MPYRNGFVLAGRNMREVEARQAQVRMFAGLTWVLTMIATFSVIGLSQVVLKDK